MIWITGKRLSSGGSRPSHITNLRWQDADNSNSTAIWTTSQLVGWIDGTDGTNQKGLAKVYNPTGPDVAVHTVHPAGRPAYVQTSPDNTTTDNLLSLPNC